MVSDFSTSFISSALKSRRADSPGPSVPDAFEVADTVFVKHNRAHRQLGGGREDRAKRQSDKGFRSHKGDSSAV